MRNRKQGKQLVEEYAKYFSHLIDKEVSIAFDIHPDLRTTLREIGLAKIADVENKPDMRMDESGKKYTPLLMHIICDGLKLVFVLEDIINIYINTHGVVIHVDNLAIMIKPAE